MPLSSIEVQRFTVGVEEEFFSLQGRMAPARRLPAERILVDAAVSPLLMSLASFGLVLLPVSPGLINV